MPAIEYQQAPHDRLEMMDWNWSQPRGYVEHPEWGLTRSEFFRQQGYGCFWAETQAARSAIAAYPVKCLFETDFPHPVNLTPSGTGLAEVGAHAREHVAAHYGDPGEAMLRKILHANAARVNHVS